MNGQNCVFLDLKDSTRKGSSFQVDALLDIRYPPILPSISWSIYWFVCIKGIEFANLFKRIGI